MCLILFAHRPGARIPLILAANRDEFYERPTAPAHFWVDAPDVLAGRDLKAGGTWCGVTRSARFAAVTNVREPGMELPTPRSRGDLVAGFLRGDESPARYLERVAGEADAYSGFNLLVGTAGVLYYFSNREGTIREVPPGVHGLSNHRLDTPWPKVRLGRERLASLLDREVVEPDTFFELLLDETQALDEELPETGVGRALERVLSSAFIRTPRYGTRASTVLWFEGEGTVHFHERSFTAEAAKPELRTYTFSVEP